MTLCSFITHMVGVWFGAGVGFLAASILAMGGDD